MVLALGIDEERPVLTGSHRLACVGSASIPGGHGIAQIVRSLSSVIRDLELLLVRCHRRIFLDIQRELLVLDHRLLVGTFDGDVDRIRSGAVVFAFAIIHGDAQVEFRFFPLQQAVGDICIGREGIAAVLFQRELAPRRVIFVDHLIDTRIAFCGLTLQIQLKVFLCGFLPFLRQGKTAFLRFDFIGEGRRSPSPNFRTAHIPFIAVRGLDLAFNGLTRIRDLQTRDRFDDRPVIDACDGHMDGDLVRARRNIEGLLDTIAFVQALDDIAAVVEHETVAPLAIVALFQDQRAVFGLDHMGFVALSVLQPDLIGRDIDIFPF